MGCLNLPGADFCHFLVFPAAESAEAQKTIDFVSERFIDNRYSIGC